MTEHTQEGRLCGEDRLIMTPEPSGTGLGSPGRTLLTAPVLSVYRTTLTPVLLG